MVQEICGRQYEIIGVVKILKKLKKIKHWKILMFMYLPKEVWKFKTYKTKEF